MQKNETAMVTEANFSPGKRYMILSEDGTKVLHATDQNSSHAFQVLRTHKYM